jgi:hypothetical protein
MTKTRSLRALVCIGIAVLSVAHSPLVAAGQEVFGEPIGEDDGAVGGPMVYGQDVGSPPVGGPAVYGQDVGSPPIGGPDVEGAPVGSGPIGGPMIGGEPVEEGDEGAPIGGDTLY